MTIEEQLYSKLSEVSINLANEVNYNHNNINTINTNVDNINDNISTLLEIKDNLELAINSISFMTDERFKTISLEKSLEILKQNNDLNLKSCVGLKIRLLPNLLVIKGNNTLYYFIGEDYYEVESPQLTTIATDGTEEIAIIWYFPNSNNTLLLPNLVDFEILESYFENTSTPNLEDLDENNNPTIPEFYYNCSTVYTNNFTLLPNKMIFNKNLISNMLGVLPQNTNKFIGTQRRIDLSTNATVGYFDTASIKEVTFTKAVAMANLVNPNSPFNCSSTQNLSKTLKLRFPELKLFGNGVGSTNGSLFQGKLDIEVPYGCEIINKYFAYDPQGKMTINLKCTDATRISDTWCLGSSIKNLILADNWGATIKLDYATNGTWELDDYINLFNNKLRDWTLEENGGYTSETAPDNGYVKEIVIPGTKFILLQSDTSENGGAAAILNAQNKLWRISGGAN